MKPCILCNFSLFRKAQRKHQWNCLEKLQNDIVVNTTDKIVALLLLHNHSTYNKELFVSKKFLSPKFPTGGARGL